MWDFGCWGFGHGSRPPGEPLMLTASAPLNKDFPLPKTTALAKGSLRLLQSTGLAEALAVVVPLHHRQAAPSHTLAWLQGPGWTQFKRWDAQCHGCVAGCADLPVIPTTAPRGADSPLPAPSCWTGLEHSRRAACSGTATFNIDPASCRQVRELLFWGKRVNYPSLY